MELGVYEKKEEKEYVWPAVFQELLERAKRLRIHPKPREELKLPDIKLVKRMDPSEDSTVVGVDGSHVGKDLAGHYLGLATGMAYSGKPKMISDKEPLSDGDIYRFLSPRGGNWLSLIDAKYVFDLARLAIKRHTPDYIILDGPLLVSPRLLYLIPGSELDIDRGTTYQQDLEACIKSVTRLLDFCLQKEINLVGLVKRARSTLIDERNRDSAILDRYMAYKQMAGPLEPGLHPALVRYEKEAKALELDTKRNDFIKIVWLKSSKVKPPLRLEVPYWVEEEEMANLVLTTSDPISGIPAHIRKVESMIQVGNETLRSVYLRILWQELGRDPKSEAEFKPLHGEEFTSRWEPEYREELEH